MTNKSDDEVNKYIQDLNAFITGFPAKEEELNEAVEKKDTNAVINHVKEVQESLTSISADFLASECSKKLETLANERPENIASYVEFLITSLKSVSIDIQMALFTDGDHPAYSSPESPAASDVDAVVSKIKKEGDRVVLVVDDDTFCLEQMKRAMREFTCKVIAVPSGEKALDALKEHKPCLFILDIEMPIMNGIDLAKSIRNLGFKEPIIFITGYANKDYVIKAANAGASDFIVKPIIHSNVVGRIGKFL
jgi:CheY-like chemotaxis protein/HPt (histidine-containing phosphotransfer) domain-containing protein